MKYITQIAFLLAGLLVLPSLASEQTTCKGKISIIKTHEVIPTASGRTLIIVDIEADEEYFFCKGLNKKHTKGIYDKMLTKHISIEMGIEKQYFNFKTGALYEAEYLYPDDFWYTTKSLDAKTISTDNKERVKKNFLIAKSTKSYKEAEDFAVDLSDSAGLTYMRSTHYNKALGLSHSKTLCEDANQNYPCYIARGYKDGVYVSIEYTDAYDGFTKGYYVVMVANGIYAKQNLKKIKKYVPDAYVKNIRLWAGCD